MTPFYIFEKMIVIMNVAIVDDIKTEAETLSALIREYSALNQLDTEISYFESAEALLASYTPFQFTVIFMDIYMEGMTGLKASEQILEMDRDALIVFITSSDDHMSEAFRLHAYEYLEKPAEKSRVFHLMDDLMKKTTLVCPSLCFNCGREEYRLKYSEIISACADRHNVEIRDTTGKEYRAYLPFYAVSEPLGRDSRFLLVNRGVLVNMDHITHFEKGVCYLTGSVCFPVNMRKSRGLEQTWQNYMFNKVRREMTGRP